MMTADAETKLPLYLEKDPNSARDFRREIEREYRAALVDLQKENEEKSLLIERLQGRIGLLESDFHNYRETHVETLKSAHSIVNASIVVRGMIVGMTIILALIGGLATTVEVLKGMFQK